MKCHKCPKPAVVHLTEILPEGDGGGHEKRAVEIHLCLAHAVEAGLVVPGPEIPPQSMTEPVKEETGLAILPVTSEPAELAVRTSKSEKCPQCGLSWNEFKQGGLMGCGHDYDLFSSKVLPLLKRAQEGATSHVGKVPPRRKTADTERQVVSHRLRRELQRAIDAENYEQAAQLRDQLRRLEQN